MIFKPGTMAVAGIISVLAFAAQGWCDDSAGIADTHRLQREQQLDAMSLSIGQGLTNAKAADLDHRQRLQLQQLELQQRMQQQLLEQQQLRQSNRTDNLLRSEPPSSRIAQTQIEQRQFSQERRQQLQHFEVQRQSQLQQFQWERQQQSLNKPLAPPRFSLR